MAKLTTVILAAGKGTRMKSKLPKVLHKVGGHPMLEHVMDAAEAAGCRDNVVVIGHGAELVRKLVGNRARIALQAEQLGTGHAVLQAADTLKDFTGTVMILCGDTPLLEAAELRKFYEEHVQSGAAATVMSAIMEEPYGYGRILRDENGDVAGIVEQKDATEEQKLIKEINIARYRRERAKKRCAGAELLLSELEECLPAGGDPAAAMDEALLTAAIADWLGTLGADDRALFIRRYWYGDALKDLAAACGVGENRMAQRMRRLRARLRAVLEKGGFSL